MLAGFTSQTGAVLYSVPISNLYSLWSRDFWWN